MIKMYTGLHRKYPLFMSDLMKREFSRQIFEKYSKAKFYENPSSGRQVIACRRTDRWTGMMNLSVALHNSAKGPKICT